jgi:hypothetical protein
MAPAVVPVVLDPVFTDAGVSAFYQTFKQLIEQTDLKVKQGNFLASMEDHDFVCGMRARRPMSGRPGL